MKKSYLNPSITVVKLQQQSALLTGSGLTTISSNVGFDDTITGGTGEARTRENSVWDSEW